MNVIIYVVDSLRASFLSCYGYHKQTSPNIDRFSKQSVLFKNAFSVSTWTRPAGASILTGMYPDALGIETMDDYFDVDIPRLPEFFKKIGHKTVGISAMPNISSHFGFGRGFDEFIDLYKDDSICVDVCEKTSGGMFKGHLKENIIKNATSEDINNCAFRYLDSTGDENFFMFIWSIDTHSPYFIKGATDKFDKPLNQEILYYQDIVEMKSEAQVKRLIDIYEKMIYYNDYQFGCLIKKLVDLDLYDKTMIIVVSDHGEAFMEHGFNGHNGPPYDNQIRVALLVKFPQNRFSNIVHDTTVQLIDIFPTLLSYFNVSETPQTVQGENLLPRIRKNHLENERDIYIIGNLNPLYGRYAAIRKGCWKLIRYDVQKPSSLLLRAGIKPVYRYLKKILNKKQMLFDLLDDSSEKQDVSKYHKDICKHLYDEISKMMSTNKKIASQIESVVLDRDLSEKQMIKSQLRSLGYVD